MELKSTDIRDVMIKLQGQLEMLNGLFTQAVEEEKKKAEKANADSTSKS